MYTKEQYKEMLIQLKPRGQLLRSSPNFDKILEVYAEQLRLTDEQTEYLVQELITSSSEDLLDEWEEIAGLENSSLSISERQEKLVEKFSARLNLNKGTLKILLESHGYVIDSIDECWQFRVEDRVEARLFSLTHAFYFIIFTTPPLYVTHFKVEDRVESRLVEYDDGVLVDLVRKYKPAYTKDLYNLT